MISFLFLLRRDERFIFSVHNECLVLRPMKNIDKLWAFFSDISRV
jgi:hypothetical protein